MNKVLRGAGGKKQGGETPINTPDTLFSDDIVEFSLGVCEGPVGGLVNGPKGFYLDDTPLVSPSGSNNFSQFKMDVYHGSSDPSVIYNELGGETSNTTVNLTLASNTFVQRTTPAVLRNKIDYLEVRMAINQLLQTNPQGDQLEETAYFYLEYKASSSSQWLPFYGNPQVTIRGKTSGGFVKEYRKWVPRIAGDWDIRVMKISPDVSTTTFVSMNWESFQCVTATPRAYNQLAVVKGIARASDQFTSIPAWSGIWAGKLIKIPDNYNPATRHYTGAWGGTFITAHSDNPAWCCYDILTDPTYGMKAYYPDLLVDRFSFYEAARWCDELVPRGDTGTYQPRYTYNDVLSEPRPGLEHVRYIASIFGGILDTDLNGTIHIRVDKPGSMTQVYGPESVTSAGFSYQFTDISQRPNDITSTFINPVLDWEQDVRRVYDQELIDRNGRIPQNFVAVGCLDVYEAQRRAFNMLLKANTEVCTVSFQTARQGIMLGLFSIIGIADPDMNWGLAGRVQSVTGAQIFLRDTLTVPVATNLSMAIQTPTGVVTFNVQSATANTKRLVIQGATPYPANAPARAQFTLSSTSFGLVKPFRVMSLSQDGENPDLFNIVALEMNNARYADADNMTSSGVQDYTGTFSLGPQTPTITKVSSGTAQSTVAPDGVVRVRMEIELTLPPSLTGQIEVSYRRRDSDVFQTVVTNGLVAYVPSVDVGFTYELFAVAIAPGGVRSSKSPVVSHLVIGRNTPMAVPTGWVGTSGFDTITLTGNASAEIDFKEFRIYGATAVSTTLTLLASTPSTYYVRRPPAGDLITRYKVTAVSTSGVESAATSFIAAIPLVGVGSGLVAMPTGLTATPSFNSIWLVWDENGNPRIRSYELFENTIDSLVGAVAKFASPSPSFVRSGLPPSTTKFYWVRAVDIDGGRSVWSAVASATTVEDVEAVTTAALAGLVDSTSFAAGVRPIEPFAVLPVTGNFENRLVLLPDGKIYKFKSGAYTAEVDGADIKAASVSTVQLAAGSVIASKMLIGDPTNLYLDYDMLDPAVMRIESGAPLGYLETAAGGLGKRYAVQDPGAVRAVYRSKRFPLEGSGYYSFEGKAWVGTTGTSLYSELYVDLFRIQEGTGNVVYSRTVTVCGSNQGFGHANSIGRVNVQAYGDEKLFEFVLAKTAVAGFAAAGGFVVRRRMTGQLIVDGEIRANHLTTTSAVITGRAQISNAVIDNAHIQDLSVNSLKIAGNSVDTWRLMANAVSDYSFARRTTIGQIGPGELNACGITRSGDPLRINMMCTVRNNSTTAGRSWGLSLYRNGVFIQNYTGFLVAGEQRLANILWVDDAWATGWCWYQVLIGGTVGLLHDSAFMDLIQLKR